MSLFIYYLMMVPIFCFPVSVFFQFLLIFSLNLVLFLNFISFYSNLGYGFGLDYYSFGLLMLTIYVVSLMVFSFFSLNPLILYFVVYLLLFMLMMVFFTLNIFFMYLFFEFSLIPLIILIFGWGYQPERLVSGLYLFFYTMVASMPFLFYVLYIYMNFGSVFFDYKYGDCYSFLVHFCMFLVFMVKFPMYMFHFWLPKAHVYSPVFGSMILAGLMLKLGGYGIIRLMFIYENLFFCYSYIWFSFGIYGSLMVSFICFMQGDMKCLIAYSSVSHMGLCILGLLTMSKVGILGSYYLMIGHGLCSSGLFYLSNIIYSRLLSRSFYLSKGLLMFMPSISMWMFIMCFFNMGCPPSLNFISEIFILISILNYWPFSLYYFVMVSFLTACFCIYLFSFSQHGFFSNLYSFSFPYFHDYLMVYMHVIPIFILLFTLGFSF
uniref:NADH dehydrogenase subunit 4 n=1 Tax=Multinervis guangxiensis TaxID=1792637 RepID=UPI0030020304|nr:NADH dehydrogenase subunit 4 [Multinervis guangxiensis]